MRESHRQLLLRSPDVCRFRGATLLHPWARQRPGPLRERLKNTHHYIRTTRPCASTRFALVMDKQLRVHWDSPLRRIGPRTKKSQARRKDLDTCSIYFQAPVALVPAWSD